MADRNHTDTTRRPSSTDRHSRQGSHVRREDFDDSLMLRRTNSLEPGGAESVAVQESLPPSRPKHVANGEDDADEPVWPHSIRYMVLLCAFLTSLSFGVTQVPLLYVFRLMTCDAYFKDHPQHQPGSLSLLSYAFGTSTENTADRCSIRPIESATALSVSLLGASTTVFGLLNLFLTGALIKRIGVKPTLLIQVFFPAVRLLVQNVGVEVWGNTGIIIIQCSQIVSIIGGPSGYLLVLNTFITEVVEYEGRTAALGRLTGSMMFGSALGFLAGGIVAESFGIKAPFRLTFILFLISGVFAAVFLPHINPPEALGDNAPGSDALKNKTNKKSWFARYFGPLAVFAPRKFIGTDGVVRTEHGAFLLAWGVFLGILATGYLPTLLQLYATDRFSFGTKQNGWLIFVYSTLRGVFLTFAFPKFIAIGRKINMRKEERARQTEQSETTERQPLLSSQNGHADPDNKDAAHKKQQTFTFDLTYTQGSLIADGLLTLLCTFVRNGWQIYLVAAVLPFAAGTGSASKGTILQMIGSSATSSERTDALAGVSLVENMARLSTTSIFGIIFAVFAGIGRTELVFTVNAAVALIGFCVLLFARFPLEGSRPLDKENISED
ncbi:major facilitator superfamily domain-containing protein [Exophiala viscosa]|uniref:Major facilitator superfamily domain-containing protein n=1 Tax=Exophiala viscosa TaxID=2486360 RepID=A0AAN6IEX5_9EURO|nr:major facilitator superfamily domain-containing protein [Exophiala viscosa]